jgi:serine/threonine protein kinase
MRTLQPGEIFDNQYKLIKLIDTGGFADVWKASHTAAKDHIVAIKVYPMLDEEGVKNIENEYDTQKDLSHTHLLTAKHFGKDADGHPYIVMKYCSSGNAANSIGKYSEKDIAKIMQQVSSALAYLHEEDVIHQDIKPNNILIDEKDMKESFFLADLGLSLKVRNTIKRFTENKRSNSSSIQTGLTPPPYRAPELWGKDNLHKDPIKATDVWAFGATLFELITDDVPFGEFGGLNQKNDPEPPDLPESFKCVNQDLNHILKKCLSREPWDRPKAQDLVELANSFLNTGDWKLNTSSTAKLTSSIIETSTSQNIENRTILNSEPRIRIRENNNKIKDYIKWVAIALLGFAGAFGVEQLFKSDSEIIIPNNIPEEQVKTSAPVIQEVIPEKSVVKEIDKVDKDVKIGKDEKTIPKKGIVEPPTPSETIIGPLIDRKPKGKYINISKIKRTRNFLEVSFLLNNTTSEDMTYSIYGPGDYAFVIEHSGQFFKMTNVSPTVSSGILKPNDTKEFRAVFDGVPIEINKVNILEGMDQTRKEQNHWNFMGVTLPTLN